MAYVKVYANKKGKFWLRLFVILAILGFIGVATLISGKLVYLVTLETVNLSTPVLIKIDLKSNAPIYSLHSIPGWSTQPEGTRDADMGLFQFEGYKVYYMTDHWDRLIQELAASSRTNNQAIVGAPTTTKESEWKSLNSGQSFQATYIVSQSVTNQPSVADWELEVSKLSVDEAIIWIKSQSQVKNVKITLISQLFANFSKKVLQTDPRVVIVLDK